jgi:hypothetical protein
MRRWPPLFWLPIYIASGYLQLSSNGRTWPLIVGAALAFLGFALAVWAALADWPGHPRPRWFLWAIGGVAALYVVVGLAAIPLGTDAVAATLLAALVPVTAVSLLLATMRSKTVVDQGRLRDVAGDSSDPYPGFGIDEEAGVGGDHEHSVPLGDEKVPPPEQPWRGPVPRAR